MNKGRMFQWMLLIAGAFLVITADTALGQLLFRSGAEQEFYGRTGYNKYGRSVVNRSANPKYDEFGNYIMDGVRIFEWNEEKRYSPSTTAEDRWSSLYKTNNIDEGEYFRQYLNNLVVVNESTKSFSSRFIVGNEVRVRFSPLTIDMAAMNGVRWDTNFGNNNLTFVSSRSDLPMWFSREIINEDLRNRLSPVYLTGAHYERQFGILNVAANYVNQYKTDSTQARRFRGSNLFSDIRDSVTGSVTNSPAAVQMLVVKVEDGSRFDGNGPRIYDLYPVIEGVADKTKLVGITKENWERDILSVKSQVDNPALDFYENTWMLESRRIPQFTKFNSARLSTKAPGSNYLYLRKSGTANLSSFASLNADGKSYLEVNGNDYLLFWFEIPKKTTKNEAGQDVQVPVEEVTFRALVGNDYTISISEIYEDVNSADNAQSAKYFQKILEAPGNVKDMSNLKWISFRYGMETANMIMGIRLSSHIKGFSMTAEFNKNFNYYQYPNVNANKFRRDAEAYYINVKKELGRFAFGTELFNIDPDYSTTFENTDPTYLYMKSIPMSSWTSEFLADVSGRGGSTSPISSSSSDYMNNTMVIESVDDNDDKDRYPDFHLFSDVRDMNGIFPGLDANGNQRPDTNENENLVPDYAEPFFLYNVDPDEYSFGDDLNNNNVIDNREDDDKPDYPYNRDTRGYHVFGSWGSSQGIKYSLGVINYSQLSGGGENDIKYGKVEYQKFIPFFANINFATVFKKSEDSISDNVFRFSRQLTTSLRDSSTYAYNYFYENQGVIPEKYYDPLDYRDSYVSTSFLDTKLFRIPNLTIGLKLKYDLNHQNANSYQGKNNIIERAQVLRADYRYYYGDLLIMPQVKFMSRKYTNGDKIEPTFHEQYFYPILRAEYPLTFNTTLKFGAQGFPGLKVNDKTIIPALNSTVRDLVNDQLDYDTRDYILMVTNRSMYNGYDFSLNFGYQVNWQDLKGAARSSLSRSNRVLFIRLVVGMEPVS